MFWKSCSNPKCNGMMHLDCNCEETVWWWICNICGKTEPIKKGDVMRSRESCVDKLKELNSLQNNYSIDGTDKEIHAKCTLRAQMKGILFAMNDVRYETFKIASNDPLVMEAMILDLHDSNIKPPPV